MKETIVQVTMNVFWQQERFWIDALSVAVVLWGAMLFWRGLRGGSNDSVGLLRRRDGMLGRMEGFRLMVFGLALIGIGAAAIWQAEWLLWLSVGFAIVEILESSTLIAVWKRGRRG